MPREALRRDDVASHCVLPLELFEILSLETEEWSERKLLRLTGNLEIEVYTTYRNAYTATQANQPNAYSAFGDYFIVAVFATLSCLESSEIELRNLLNLLDCGVSRPQQKKPCFADER